MRLQSLLLFLYLVLGEISVSLVFSRPWLPTWRHWYPIWQFSYDEFKQRLNTATQALNKLELVYPVESAKDALLSR